MRLSSNYYEIDAQARRMIKERNKKTLDRQKAAEAAEAKAKAAKAKSRSKRKSKSQKNNSQKKTNIIQTKTTLRFKTPVLSFYLHIIHISHWSLWKFIGDLRFPFFCQHPQLTHIGWHPVCLCFDFLKDLIEDPPHAFRTWTLEVLL